MPGARNCREQGEYNYKEVREETETVSILNAMVVNRYIHDTHGKESAYKAKDPGLIPGSRRSKIQDPRSSGEGNGYPIQYSCLENSTDRRVWWATVHRIAESDMTEQLSALIK